MRHGRSIRSRGRFVPTHGESLGTKTPEYRCWLAMLARCYSASAGNFHLYGGRGIAVCDRWRSSYEAFLADMGRKLTPEHSIDRVDNDGNYEPGNCRWATRTEQARNRRTNNSLAVNGIIKTQVEWASWSGLGVVTIRQRLALGWSAEDAVSIPVGGRRSRQKLFGANVADIVERIAAGESQRSIAKGLGVTHTAIADLIRRHRKTQNIKAA